MRIVPFIAIFGLMACRVGGDDPRIIDADGDGAFSINDCNDADSAIYPGAGETCDGVDNDCNTIVDDVAVGTATTYYADADGDGYGNSSLQIEACDVPSGYADSGGDCNDSDTGIHPGAAETDCTDGTDYNCDGSSGYADADSDGFAACEDCDDTDAHKSPLGVEVCDGADDDCDGEIDNAAVDAGTWYADVDGDGYGNSGSTETGCEAPASHVANDDDCDDAAAGSYPGADELCDAADNNCNGLTDENATDATTWYADIDNDGYGGSNLTQDACSAPPGYKSGADDCDDLDANSNPAGTEVCDGADNDCNNSVDDSPTDEPTWYNDGDGDGYGDADDSTKACAKPAGFSADWRDCDDDDDTTHPGAAEWCDDADNNCNGAVDDNPADPSTFFADIDGDGFGGITSVLQACTAPANFAATADDCDDADANFHPGADLGCDGLDYDCDGETDNDLDADGYTDGGCGGDDCDDADPLVYPGQLACASGRTCKDILDAGRSEGDGIYTIDVDGYGTGLEPLDVVCDMTRQGGGWTFGVKSWYQSGGGHYRNTGAVGDVANALTKKGGNYKLSDEVIRGVIGPDESFDLLGDQAGYNSYYSTGNYEYAVLRNYTGTWRWDAVVTESTSSTTLTSYRQSDNAVMWQGLPTCGYSGGAGINCYNVRSGSGPNGGSNCASTLGKGNWTGTLHFFMAETNQDTYMYLCNGAQHSSSYDLNHRWWFRER